MQVFYLSSLKELAPYRDAWDRLAAGVPFRGWTWLSTWWRHYGQDAGVDRPGHRLFVLCVFDHNDTLVGVAPWYVRSSPSSGRVIRPLGSGEVCTDYLSVLCRPQTQYLVTQAIADFLTDEAQDDSATQWDLLELGGIDAEDVAVDQLLGHLAEQGNSVHRRPGPNCWRIVLPSTFNEYLAGLAKDHRKQLRRLARRWLDTGRAKLHSVQTADELPRGIEILIDLHQRRRASLGEPGCFASPRFAAFHREVMAGLLAAGQLQLKWIDIEGKPAAIEYLVTGNDVVYCYQSGMDPDAMEHEPGKLAHIAAVRWAIAQGYRALDQLRGDEHYKLDRGGRPRPSVEARVVPNRIAAQVRHNLWLAGHGVKQWVKARIKD